MHLRQRESIRVPSKPGTTRVEVPSVELDDISHFGNEDLVLI